MQKIKRVKCLIYVILAFAFTYFCGCEGPAKPTADKQPVSSQIEQLKEHNRQLQVRLEQEYGEKEQLKKQISALQGLPPEKKADAIYKLQSVTIGKYTNFYDKNEKLDQVEKEKLIVYIQPTDETGDSIKAAGEIGIQLWDLGKRESEALVGQWIIKPEQLKTLWLQSAFTSSYRLVFDVSTITKGKVKNDMTVRITFTDYISGKTFTDQKTIKPQ